MPQIAPKIRRGVHQLRKGRRSIPDQIYHVTTATMGRKIIFDQLTLGRIVVDVLRRESTVNNVASLAYVVMPDHFHWLMRLPAETCLSKTVNNVKSLSTRRINRRMRWSGSLWHRGFYDRAIRSEDNVIEVARYIIANPLRAGLVDGIGAYPLWDAIWVDERFQL